jgi:hypothetical protein
MVESQFFFADEFRLIMDALVLKIGLIDTLDRALKQG